MAWDIFDEMRRFQEEMDRMFSSYFSRPSYQLGQGRDTQEGVTPEPYQERMPAVRKAFVDVEQTDEDVIITAELPGMKKEDVELNVTSDSVEIKAQIKEETKEEKEGFKAYSKRYAGFYQNVPLPASVKAEDAQATFKNGVLEVVLPKKEITKSHNVTIN